jgi:PAS domain S-box-containing protein
MEQPEQVELGRALFQESGDALFLLDPETDRLIDINGVALKLTGFNRSEVIQYPATNLFRIETSGGLQKLRGAFIQTMEFHGLDGYLLRTREDAAWIPVNLTVSRLHVPPKPLGLIVARDDRERRGALAQARRVEAELRTVLANAPAALWSAERFAGPDVFAGWLYRYVSPLLAVIADRPPEFFDHPMRWIEAIHAGDRERYRTALRQLLLGTESEVEQLYRVPVAKGPPRWVRDRLQVVRDKSGRPTRLDGCVSDVTAQRRAEDAVRKSERRFRALVEKGGDSIVLLDDKRIILYASPSVRTISGYEPAEIVGRDWFDFVVPEDMESARQLMRETLRRPGESLSWCGKAFKPDGSFQLLELNICNRLDDPSVRALVLNYRDITDRGRLEEALRQAAKMEAVGRLAGGVAHDFNNLLTVVLGNLELVRGGRNAANADELLAASEAAAKQAADLTRQMLGFARRQPLQSALVDLNALTRDEISLMRHSIDPRIAITFTPAADLHRVLADPVQIQQVLLNLCLNARDAMPEGGTLSIQTANAAIPATAQIDGPSPEGYVCISIADTGNGMTDEVRARVFEPFFTTKDVGRGTGLGLAVVYGVARRHGGWVECHSSVGRGSRFDVYLPYAEETRLPAGSVEPIRPAEDGRGETVLLADDEQSVRAMAEAGLIRHGYRFIAVEDGGAAVNAFRAAAEPVAVVVLDLMMPVMGGHAAFEAIRELDPNVLVLFASGYSAIDQLPDPLPPRTAFLAKPYTPSQLAAAIRGLLDSLPHHLGSGI